MNNVVWLIYGAVVLIVSGLIGLHLGKFREAYTEMTGMMAGMMMGMLNGFMLGYAAGAATATMFWGNLIGIILGLSMGVYFGRAGSLMGILDGGMGGVMGGSMGAMLALMVYFPEYGLYWTAVLLGVIYILGMAGLVALIEQSSPGHAALHRLMPMFTRAVAQEVAEEGYGPVAPPRRQRPTAAVASPSGPAAHRSNAKPRTHKTTTQKSNNPPISGVGIFMGALLVAVLIGWWAMSNGSRSQATVLDESTLPKMSHIEGVPDQNADDQAALEAQAVPAQLVDGVQMIDFVVIGDSMSYRPNVIKVKQGMPVRFNVSVEGRDPG